MKDLLIENEDIKKLVADINKLKKKYNLGI